MTWEPNIKDAEWEEPYRFRPRTALDPGKVRVGFKKKGKTIAIIEQPISCPAGANVFISKNRVMVLVVEGLP